jgi:hypothetical protein
MSATGATIMGKATGITADEALKIARQDGEKAYLDLSPYRIEISLEQDGWHIDYEFKNPEIQGGGRTMSLMLQRARSSRSVTSSSIMVV